MRPHRAGMISEIAPGQQAAMDFRVQSLDPAIHDFGKTSDISHFCHCEAGLAQRLMRAAGRQQCHAALAERAGEVDQPGFVGH